MTPNPTATPAAITPEQIAAHGLSTVEFQVILDGLGRQPTWTELGVFSVMWSEHCSYKSSRIHLKRLPTTGPRVVIGPGENAGVVDIGDGLGVCFKMESHNHPSYIEPYQGAATGVGGILRDVFTMGARPVALMNSLRFGRLEHPKTRTLVHGVVAGIGGYGNCMGIPTIGGETRFDESYDGNCLVNAFCAGIVPLNKIFLGAVGDAGNKVFYVGAGTGRDGIHGATMASASFEEGNDEKRPTVQVGDPFQEKLLLEACLELMGMDVLVGIQDMGAAGLTSSSVEMAGRSGAGLLLELDKVPTREIGMTPYELLLSESQERMLLVIKPGNEKIVFDTFAKWDLRCAEVGTVTADGLWRCTWHGDEVCAIPVPILTDAAPKYDRPRAARTLSAYLPEDLVPPADLGAVLLQLLASPDVSDKRWIWRQYDHQVGTDTEIGPGLDAALIRVKGTAKHLAFVCDSNGHHVFADPRVGTAGQVAECVRNLACVGADPIGLSDCMNFGNPQKPDVMWEFSQSVDGMSEACLEFGVPVVSGNVSLYNETNDVSILPTPGLAMVGLFEGPAPKLSGRWGEGKRVALLGEPVATHLGASLYLREVHGLRKMGLPPPVNYEVERSLCTALRTLVRAGTVELAHDCADGGLAVALAECARNVGAALSLDDGSVAALFGEDHGRAIVAYAPENDAQVRAVCAQWGVSFRSLGLTGGERLVLLAGGPVIDVAVADIAIALDTTFPGWVDG